MAKLDVLDILRLKRITPLEFDFDNLWIPPIQNYLTFQDIEGLKKIATSIRLSSKINEKYRMIDNIMRARGFKRFAAGTNRVVYSYLEDDRFLVKIAVDKVGMQDNPLEYENQFLLKPYVTKMFYTSPCGTVGFCERVLPVKNRAEFKEIADDVFEILINKILGKYVVEDVGTKFFMNWGIRYNHGPVLLDYPYIYKLDGAKLYCSKKDLITGLPCNGEIDYDEGFNNLICTKCGKRYLATDLRDNSVDNKIIIKGGNHMKIAIKKGDTYISSPIEIKEVMSPPKKSSNNKSKGLVVSVYNPNTDTRTSVKSFEEILSKPSERKKTKYNLGVSVNIGGHSVDNKADEKTEVKVEVKKEVVEKKKEVEASVNKTTKKETSVKEDDNLKKSDIKSAIESDLKNNDESSSESTDVSKEEIKESTNDSDYTSIYDDEEDNQYESLLKGNRKPARDSKGRFVKKKYKDDDFDNDGPISRKSKKDRISTKSKFID